MNVVALNGSPRKEGNCHHALAMISGILSEEGIRTEEIQVGNAGLKTCISCFRCFETADGRCALGTDGFDDIQKRIVDSDALILATPVYTAGVTAALKAFLERSSLVSLGSGGQFNRKPALAMAVARRAGTLPALDDLNRYLQVCGMISVGSTYWNVAYGNGRGQILLDAEGMETFRNAAANLAWLMKSLDVARKTVPEPDTPRRAFTNLVRDDLEED